jgi:hypothetical protein
MKDYHIKSFLLSFTVALLVGHFISLEHSVALCCGLVAMVGAELRHGKK